MSDKKMKRDDLGNRMKTFYDKTYEKNASCDPD